MSKKKTAKKKVLGRGLGNLLDTSVEAKQQRYSQGILDIDLNKIRTNPDNPRKKFNQSAIEDLAQTIKVHGLLQPIMVTEEGDHYRVIAGERRLRACRSLKKKQIPCIVKDLSSAQVHEISLIENIQREQLDPIEEALAFRAILENNSLTQEQLAVKIGKNRSTITNRMRLLNLPLNVQTAVADGKLTEGQVRPLLVLKDDTLQSKLAGRIMKEGLNARATEALVKRYTVGPTMKSSTKKKKSANIEALEKRLEEKLQTRVRINHDAKRHKGKIAIEYFNLDDLDKVLKLFGIKKY